MNSLSNTFLRLAVIFALIGVSMGYGMGASGNHVLLSVHAHINLLGWVSMFLYGLFYRVFPTAGSGALARLHLWTSLIGLVIMAAALAAKVLAIQSLATLANVGLIVGSTLVVVGMIMFAVILFRATSERAAPST